MQGNNAAAGAAGGIAGDSTASAATGAQSGKNAVENNALSDIAENQASGMSQQEKYQKAQDALVKATEEFKAKNCAGLSSEACGAKIEIHRDELLAGAMEFGSDFVPVYSDIKSFAEAQSAYDYLIAVIGVFPPAKGAKALLNGVEVALKKGDVAEASKLLNKASDEIATTIRPGHRQSELDVGKDLGDEWRDQISFKDGKEVPYGTKNSVRPDWCQGNTCSVEVKNYNIATNQSGLINNVAKQAIERQKNLPSGMQQEVVIDVRGQTISAMQEDAIIRGIVQKSNGIIKPTDIQFKR